jgi:hypothetical protein
MTFVWPKTIAEVAHRVVAGEDAFDRILREFLDHFYTATSESRALALQARPEPIDALHDAYIAATAEHLARRWNLAVPSWTEDHGFALKRPHYSGGLESLKAILTAESPTAFRRRLLFVSADALDRASMQRSQ